MVNGITGWWFGTFFIFPYIGNNHPNWLIFFRGVETTNQDNGYILINAVVHRHWGTQSLDGLFPWKPPFKGNSWRETPGRRLTSTFQVTLLPWGHGRLCSGQTRTRKGRGCLSTCAETGAPARPRGWLGDLRIVSSMFQEFNQNFSWDDRIWSISIWFL